MNSLLNKKGQSDTGGLGMLLGAGIMIVILALTFGLGGMIVTDISAGEPANNTTLYNASMYGGEALNDMSSYLPLIGLIIIIIVILGLLVGYLYAKFVK